MTTFVATNNMPIDMANATLSNLYYASITISTANQIRASWSSTAWVDFYGSFSYPNGGIAGVLNRAVEVTGGVAAYDMGGIRIDAATFLRWVNTGATSTAKSAIFGGNDVIYGSDYSDTLEYIGGSDYIDGKGGNDNLKISDGSSYDTSSPTVFVLPEGGYYRLFTTSGETILKDIESVSVGSYTSMPMSRVTFDALTYVASNRDLALAIGTNAVAAARHYISTGRAERRSITGFDPLQYLAANADLQAAYGVNPAAALAHWVTIGVREGRTATFDTARYLASNIDLLRAFGSNYSAAVQHYLYTGRAEGRSTTRFNPAAYLAANRDLARLGIVEGNAAAHYVTAGYYQFRPTGSASLAAA